MCVCVSVCIYIQGGHFLTVAVTQNWLNGKKVILFRSPILGRSENRNISAGFRDIGRKQINLISLFDFAFLIFVYNVL